MLCLGDECKTAGTASRILVVCVALEAIMKNEFEQLHKIGVAATTIGIADEGAGKNQEVRDCV